MSKILRTSGDYTIKAGDGFNSGSGANTISLDSLEVNIAGNLTVGGTSTTVNTTNTTIEDNIIELNRGATANNNSAGLIIERGSTGDNAAILWQENTDNFILGTTTATAADKSSAITVTPGSLTIGALTTGHLTATSLTANDIQSNGSNAAISILSSGTGDINLDSGGDIVLDADGADIKLEDAGTEFGRISRVTSDLVIKSMGDNNDILFKGLDASSTITALTLDMSEAGAAIFNSTITATDITANSLTTNVITSNGSNAGISIQPSGTGDVLLGALRVNGTTVSSDDSTKITVAEDVDVIGKLRLPDGSVSDNYAAFGDAEDLKIFHNGTHSIVREVGTGNLHLQSDNEVVLSKDAATELMVRAIGDGAVELYHDNVKKLETTASGVIVGGDITAGSVTTNAITSNGSNADISIQPSGTGNVEIGALTINGTTIFAAASGSIQINDPLDIDQTLTVNAAQINFLNIPTSDPGVAGRVFRDGTDLKVSTG